MSSYECQPLVFAEAMPARGDDEATVASDETASCYEVHMKLPSLDTPKSPLFKPAFSPKTSKDLNTPKASASPSVGRVTMIYIPEYWTGPGR
jgi:hypothetical protein